MDGSSYELVVHAPGRSDITIEGSIVPDFAHPSIDNADIKMDVSDCIKTHQGNTGHDLSLAIEFRSRHFFLSLVICAAS